MNQNKLSQYFFIIAAVVAILDGAFELSTAMQSLKFILLVFSGIVVGALRHHEQKEFLLSGLAVIITGFILTEVLAGTLSNFSTMIYNFVIFLSASIIVVGLEQIANIITFEHKDEGKRQELLYKEHVKQFKQMRPHEIKYATFEWIWGVIILVAVALTFIVLLAQSFFEVGALANALLIIEALITVLFIIDLVILYEKAGKFSTFLQKNLFDIIAAIPTMGVLRGLKLIRAVKIIRAMGKSMRITKMTKLYKTTKFFSEESDFNKVEKGQLKKNNGLKKSSVEKKSSKKPVSRSKVKTVSVKKKPAKRKTTKKKPIIKKKLAKRKVSTRKKSIKKTSKRKR